MDSPLFRISDLPPIPLEQIQAEAGGDHAEELRLAACWGYRLAASDLLEVTPESK